MSQLLPRLGREGVGRNPQTHPVLGSFTGSDPQTMPLVTNRPSVLRPGHILDYFRKATTATNLNSGSNITNMPGTEWTVNFASTDEVLEIAHAFTCRRNTTSSITFTITMSGLGDSLSAIYGMRATPGTTGNKFINASPSYIWRPRPHELGIRTIWMNIVNSSAGSQDVWPITAYVDYKKIFLPSASGTNSDINFTI